MTEQQPSRNGRDFAIGFFGATLVAVLLGFTLPLAIIIFLIAAPIVAFKKQRKFIGIGILSAAVAIPLLLVGTCFAVLPWL